MVRKGGNEAKNKCKREWRLKNLEHVRKKERDYKRKRYHEDEVYRQKNIELSKQYY